MTDIAELEIRIAALEAEITQLREQLSECCGEGPGGGRPCRGGRPVIVSGYEVESAEKAAELLKEMGF